jgi:hypothetical protein
MKQFNYKLSDWTYGHKVRKAVHKKILKRDIERGVKFLSDIAYSPAGGSTRGSTLFLLELKKHIDLGKVYRADLTYVNGRKHYTVKLFTTDGYTIMLKGISFGYFGEGSRGSYAVLKECGFNEKNFGHIFKHTGRTQYRFFRRVTA